MNESDQPDPAQPVLPGPDAPAPAPRANSGRRWLVSIAWLLGSALLAIVVLIADSWLGDRSLTSLETLGIPALFTLIACIRVTRGRRFLPRLLLIAVLWMFTFLATIILLALLIAVAIAGSNFAAVG